MSALSDTTTRARPRGKGLGIIGGGQLGMLLCRAARALDIRTTVLTPDLLGPAIHEADHLLIADYDDPSALGQLIEAVEFVTFEFEAVPAVALAHLQDAFDRGEVRVVPEPRTLATLQDKALQKQWLQREGLSTLPFRLTDASTTARDLLAAGFAPPLVQKARRGGYDGKGVQMLRTDAELGKLWSVPGLVEPALASCTEVAVVVASDGRDTRLAYPPVVMTFDHALNAVSTVTSATRADPDRGAACEAIAREAVTRLGAAGVYAVEFFVTDAGDVHINEISPRVHNSGHLTLDAFRHCQFEQHVRAVAGLPLAPVVPRAPAAVMLNLLYDDSMAPALSPYPYRVDMDSRGCTRLHWYGKRAPRPGRKMGHITALGMSPDDAHKRAREALARLRRGDIPQDAGARALPS